MTTEEKKAFLSRYRLAGREAQRREEELRRWESRAASVTQGWGGEPGGSPRGDALQQAVEKMLELREELGRQLLRELSLRREVEEAVAGLEDPKLRQLLRLRYLDGLTWERLAERMALDCRWVQRLHARALEALTLESHGGPVV